MHTAQQGCTVVLPETKTQARTAPLWHVVLLNDNDHTYDYVIEMLGKLFRIDPQRAYEMACEVDRSGRVIVQTTVLERAEFKRDQIRGYGPDWRLDYSPGSMQAVLEPAKLEGP
jgi:ATP-dependent Clp protease adaptor protein ClpS